MKHILTLFFIFCCVALSNAQMTSDSKELLDFFDEIELPINIVDGPDFKKRLPREMTAKFFFKGNTKAMEYEDIVINMEDQTEMGRYINYVEIIPCYYYIFNERIFVIYKYLGEDETKVRVGLIDDNGMEKSHIDIEYSNYREPITTIDIISKIYGEVIYTFEYHSLVNRDSDNNATSIQIKSYTVDYDNNKFVLSSDETIYSPIEFYLFDKYKEEPDSIKAQDPFYKY